MSNNNRKTDLEPHNEPSKYGLLLSFIIFMAWVAGIGLLLSLIACQPVNAKPIATNTNNGYYIDLSRKHASGTPSRYLLAFFVPDNSAASQAVIMQSSNDIKAHLRATRGYSLISIANHLLIDYDGLTLQNTIAYGRICRAASSDAESKTRHLLNLSKPDIQSVTLTQKSLGAIHHG